MTTGPIRFTRLLTIALCSASLSGPGCLDGKDADKAKAGQKDTSTGQGSDLPGSSGTGTDGGESEGTGGTETGTAPGPGPAESPEPPGGEGAGSATVLGLMKPEDRTRACIKVGASSLETHGVSGGQVIDCSSKGVDNMEVVAPETMCERFDLKSASLRCSMSVAQLQDCFEAAPRCDSDQLFLCISRLTRCGLALTPPVPGQVPPDPSPKTDDELAKGAVLITSLGRDQVESSCASSNVEKLAKMGLTPKDKYTCSGSGEEVEVFDPAARCSEFAKSFPLDNPLCKMNVDELVRCHDFESYCDGSLRLHCSVLLRHCGGKSGQG